MVQWAKSGHPALVVVHEYAIQDTQCSHHSFSTVSKIGIEYSVSSATQLRAGARIAAANVISLPYVCNKMEIWIVCITRYQLPKPVTKTRLRDRCLWTKYMLCNDAVGHVNRRCRVAWFLVCALCFARSDAMLVPDGTGAIEEQRSRVLNTTNHRHTSDGTLVLSLNSIYP